jgi:hypothetical protein
MQQNEILKEKVSELLDKNEDLSQVTSELSKYYYHMKKASEKRWRKQQAWSSLRKAKLF